MKKLSLLLALLLLLSLFTGCRELAFPALPSVPVSAPEGSGASTEADAAVHPMLFRVNGTDGQEMYLFGTIHVGDERVELALNKLTPYLDACDALAVEFDVVAYEKDLQAQMQAMTQFVLTDGGDVTAHMPAETFEKASVLLGEAGLYPKLMKSYNLAMWSQLVEQAALMTHTDYNLEIGMDRSLIRYCNQKQIPVRDVESAALQYGILNGFSDELYLLLIESTLENLDDYGAGIDELYAAWLDGNCERLSAVLNGDEDADGLTAEETALLEEYYDQMLTRRNLGMRDKALEWLRAGDKVFFAVGAAHLVDENGLIALLRAEGYSVEQIVYG